MKGFSVQKYLSSFSKPKMFGLDFNGYEIKAFQIEKKKDQHRITGWNRKVLPKGLIDDLEIKDKKEFGEILKDILATAQGRAIKGRGIALSIPEGKVFLRVLKMPAMSEDEIGEAIKWEVENNLPISIDEVYFDYQVVERNEKEMRILVQASAKKNIDNVVGVLEELGFQVYAVEADLNAIGRSILPKNETAPILIVDIGRDGASYFVYRNGYPVMSSGGSVSGEIFTDAVVKYYGTDEKKAESFKRQVGLGSNREDREEALQVYRPLLATLAQEIEKTLIFYNEKLKTKQDQDIKKVLVSGGGSNLKGLLSYLSIYLKKQVEQANAWENINLGKDLPAISQKDAQSYVTAIGLALRSHSNGN